MKLVLIVHNVRSAHNVGSILRSADGFGAWHVYFSGYTPYPVQTDDERLPHLRAKIAKQIHKTALGAEKTTRWSRQENIKELIEKLKQAGYLIAALEQSKNAENLERFKPTQPIALIVGNEVDGIDEATLSLADKYLQIPMKGKKESFNVAIAASVAMYHLKLNA